MAYPHVFHISRSRNKLLHSEGNIDLLMNDDLLLLHLHQYTKDAGIKNNVTFCFISSTRIWANAQRDGRPVEYRWRRLFNAAKFGWCPLLECSAVTLPRRETRWNVVGTPKSPTISAAIGPKLLYCDDMRGRHCCLRRFFPIVDRRLSFEDIARQSCAMVPRWRFLATSLGPALAASRVQHISDLHCILNSH